MQAQRYPREVDMGKMYYDFDAKPAMAKSRFVDKKRRTRNDDISDLQEVMEKVFAKEITKCTRNGLAFPAYFVNDAEGDEPPSYDNMEKQLVSCMRKLDMDIPKFPQSMDKFKLENTDGSPRLSSNVPSI